uniref:MYND-type domain-containing protein n=1 Tax=Eutreptiella gymnastica TaxID=73025 RepID=A0A7S4GC64_9EUGL|mmetsp:Transcript_89274/g.148972  ORF Transcript_89274/g.148972 Transcript_89274/m.148972 type:complete len:134 (+) Transcript_89274:360-761(+)
MLASPCPLHVTLKFREHNSGAGVEFLIRCSGCRAVSYCSRECQLGDWNHHKPNCRRTPSDQLCLHNCIALVYFFVNINAGADAWFCRRQTANMQSEASHQLFRCIYVVRPAVTLRNTCFKNWMLMDFSIGVVS